jgi:hypothetical protein
MEKKNHLLKLLIIICVISIVYTLISLSENTEIKMTGLGLIIFILSGIIIISGIVSINNNPPHIGLVTLLGNKIWKNNKPVFITEGLNWVFLKGIIFDLIKINIELKQNQFDPQEILTPDNVNIKVPISYAWKPDIENIAMYIDIGEETGVNEAIKKILEGRLREYSRHPEEGPMTWKEMIASGLKTLDYLVKGLCKSEKDLPKNGYDHLIKISDDVPTPILLDWYRKKDPPNSVIRKEWGDGKDSVDFLNYSEKDNKKVDLEEKWRILYEKIKNLNKLRKLIKSRIDLLEKLQLGKATIQIPNLGICLVRLTVGDVDPYGDIYEAEISFEKEGAERKAETFETETDLTKALMLQKAIKKAKNKEVAITECYDMIMKYKMISNGKGFVYSGSLGSISGLGNLISNVIKGGKNE